MDEENAQSASELNAALPALATRFRNDPHDPFVKYRLHCMLTRAHTLNGGHESTLERRIRSVYAPHVPVRPQSQLTSDGCGKTSVAMVIETVTGRTTTEQGISDKYGFGLLDALNGETRSTGVRWQGTALNRSKMLEALRNRLPIVVGAGPGPKPPPNPPFTPGGDRHMFVINGYDPNTNSFIYTDPNGGVCGRVTWEDLRAAAPFPDVGTFMFIGQRSQGSKT